MKYLFGFRLERCRELGLHLKELYVLNYLIKLSETKSVRKSQEDNDYFLLLHSKAADDCQAIEKNNPRNISRILASLCGNGDDSSGNIRYPVSTRIFVEHGYRNAYYKINHDVVTYLRGGTMYLDGIASHYSEDFIKKYEKIKSVYDFHHTTDKVTLSMLQAQYLIDSLLNGKFLDVVNLDTEWAKSKDLSMLEKITFDDILKSLHKYAEAKKQGGWLEHSHDVGLSTFLYNPRSKKSLFITMLQNSGRRSSSVDSMDEVFLKYTKPLLERLRLSEDFLNGLYTIYEFWKKQYDTLYAVNQKNGRKLYWENIFGTKFSWKSFMKVFEEFIDFKYVSTEKEIPVFDIGYKKKSWYKFMYYVYSNYNKVRVELFDEFYKNIENGREEA